MTTPTPQDASEENGPSRKEALKRLSHPAMQAALNAICALIEDERSTQSSGEPPAPKQTGLTLETAKEICSKLLGVPYSPPGTITVSGYIVTTEDHQFALDPDGKNDFIAVHGSKDAAQNEVSWLMEAQSNNGKDIVEIRPVRLEVRQAAQVVTDDASATDDQEATTDATPEPDYVQPWWDLEFQRQIECLADKFPGAQAHNGTSEPAPIPAQLDGTESRKLVERLIQDAVPPDSPQRRNRLRSRRAAFIERLLLILAVALVGGLGYWIAYLANTDAAFERGRADQAIELRHVAELNASTQEVLRLRAELIASEQSQLADAQTEFANEKVAHLEKLRSMQNRFLVRARDELLGLKEEDSDQAAGEPFIILRIAGEMLRQISGIADPDSVAAYDVAREDILKRLIAYMYPDREVGDVNQIFARDDDT